MANSISHGIALTAALVGAPILLMHAARHDESALVVGTGVFAAAFILLYTASTLYHALPRGRSKHVFRVLDHVAIYVLIAGTYTPFTLGVLHGPWGWSLFGAIWSLAAIGAVLKVCNKLSHPVLSNGLYLVMGWLIVIAIEPLGPRMPTTGWLWLLAGGLSYTVGVVFFATDRRLRFGHFIWHLFVVTGTACHYFAVLWYAG